MIRWYEIVWSREGQGISIRRSDMENMEMSNLSDDEIDMVSGGMDATTGGLAIIGLGLAGGPVTAVFGLAIGGSLLYLDNCV